MGTAHVFHQGRVAVGTTTCWSNDGASDNGLTRTITDTSATGAAKFYKVEITKP